MKQLYRKRLRKLLAEGLAKAFRIWEALVRLIKTFECLALLNPAWCEVVVKLSNKIFHTQVKLC